MNGFRINDIHAYLTIGPDDEEVIVAYQMGGVMMPMVAVDRSRLEHLQPHAQEVADITKGRVRLVQFMRIIDLTTLLPHGGGHTDDGTFGK